MRNRNQRMNRARALLELLKSEARYKDLAFFNGEFPLVYVLSISLDRGSTHNWSEMRPAVVRGSKLFFNFLPSHPVR